jgi:hypothetical protein
MITCRDVSTLVSTGQLGDASIRRRLGVWLHLSMCQHCRRFRRQVRLLDLRVRRIVVGFERDAPADLADRVLRRVVLMK